MREGDCVSDIMKAVNPAAFDLTRAEGRADFDDALRAELLKIDDDALRSHAAAMLRDWRRGLLSAFQYGGGNG